MGGRFFVYSSEHYIYIFFLSLYIDICIHHTYIFLHLCIYTYISIHLCIYSSIILRIADVSLFRGRAWKVLDFVGSGSGLVF